MVFNDSTNQYSVSKFIVDPSGATPYATIQAALDAADATGSAASVYIRSGSYTENLTLYDDIYIKGDGDGNTTITGIHTPPASGQIEFRNITFISATDIFSSVAANSTDMTLINCTANCTNGYIFNMANWTGDLTINSCLDTSTTNGVLNNATGSSNLIIYNSTVGSGSTPITVSGGILVAINSVFECPVSFVGASIGEFANCTIATLSDAAIAFNSTGGLEISETTIQSTNNPAITGTGSGTIQIGSVTFLSNNQFAGTLTVTGLSMETGDITLSNRTPNAVATYGTGGSVGETGPLTDGQLIIGSTGVAPVATTLTPGSGVSIVNAAGSITISAAAGEASISKYIVDADGSGDYTTIQAALDAADTAGIDATVYIRPGSYTENLTLYDGIDLVGKNTNTTIIGVHTPPASGEVQFFSLSLQSAIDIFTSAAAGTTNITLRECIVNCTNGYTFDLLNWTGNLEIYDSLDTSTTNGVLTNTGGCALLVWNSDIGQGATSLSLQDGDLEIYGGFVGCPISITGSTNANIQNGSSLEETTTTAGTSTLNIYNSAIEVGASAAITHNSSGVVNLSDLTINSTNNPAIAGTGAGAINVASVSFLNNAAFAGTLTVTGKNLETGDITLSNRTQDAVAVYGANGITSEVGPLTNGQLVVGSTGATPLAAAITAGTGISVVNGAGTITISASAGGFSWNEVTGTSQAMSVDNGYIANNAALVTLTLPATASVGDTIQVVGKGAGGWRIAQNAGQTIHIGNQSTTTGAGGNLSSGQFRDVVEFLCTTANTDWTVIDVIGSNLSVT